MEIMEYTDTIAAIATAMGNSGIGIVRISGENAVEVAENDTLEVLEAKIHEVEHVLYPQAVQLIAEGRVSVDEESGRVHIA